VDTINTEAPNVEADASDDLRSLWSCLHHQAGNAMVGHPFGCPTMRLKLSGGCRRGRR